MMRKGLEVMFQEVERRLISHVYGKKKEDLIICDRLLVYTLIMSLG